MHILKKAFSGDRVRPTRVHTEAGEFCGLEALPGLGPAGLTWARARFGGRYATLPWWVWRAIRFVGGTLRPSDRVLEVGGGFSTLWLAKRAAAVVTIEESAEWRSRVAEAAQSTGVRNLQLQDGPSFPAFCVLYPAVRWDGVIIDGPAPRLRVLEEIFREAAWRRPRFIVFDDTDRAENRPAFRLATGYHAHTFRGFKPQTLHACETTVFVKAGE